jgi:two-component system sensor histidine kinase VicK
VLHGPENTTRAILEFLSKAHSTLDICADSSWPSVAMGVDVYGKALRDASVRGVKLKVVTEITKDNLSYCKEVMKIGELRHLDGNKGNFGVSEKEYTAAATLEEATLLQQVIYSNVKEIVEQQQYLFEGFWNRAIPAEQKIREIEKGIEPEYFEVFTDRDRERVNQILLDLAESVKKEALILLPSAKALIRVDRLGVIDNIITASQRGATVKIICPISEENSDIIRKVAEQASAVRVLNGNNSSYGMYIVDGEKFLKADVKEPKAETFSQAIGFAVYSNSKPTVLSYISIFESLWQQTELYERLKESNEKLEKANEQLLATERAKEEFISMISHELKTPLVPLKGFAQMLLRPKIMGAELNEKQKDAIDVMSRSIEKLQSLVDDIMDVYKLDIGKLKFSMTDTDITRLIDETISELEPLASGKKIDLKADIKVNGTVFCDPNRIEQVLSNLIKNSIDFVPESEGRITVRAEKDSSTSTITSRDNYNGNINNNDSNNQEHNNSKNNSMMILFTLEDNGIGIIPEKIDKLFQKFYQIDTGATRKHQGTGLGLVICKGIIDAHGGKIWVDKSSYYGSGAAIKFTLPGRGEEKESRDRRWMNLEE